MGKQTKKTIKKQTKYKQNGKKPIQLHKKNNKKNKLYNIGESIRTCQSPEIEFVRKLYHAINYDFTEVTVYFS